MIGLRRGLPQVVWFQVLIGLSFRPRGSEGQVGNSPGGFNSTCAFDSLAPGEKVVLFYHDDDDTDDIPHSATEIGNGFRTDNAFFVGNGELSGMELHRVRLCLEDSSSAAPGICPQRLCYDAGPEDWNFTGETPTGFAMHNSSFQKMVWALSGQNEPGNPGSGFFVGKDLSPSNLTCLNPPYDPAVEGHCWSCGFGHGMIGPAPVGGGRYSWQSFGGGMTLDRESLDDELSWSPDHGRLCNGLVAPWDGFYVVVFDLKTYMREAVPNYMKPEMQNPPGAIYTGQTVFLKAYTGRNLDCDGPMVYASRTGKASWQSWTFEKLESGPVSPGDVIFLRGYSGRRIDVDGDKVYNRFTYYHPKQSLIVEKHNAAVTGREVIKEGDLVFFKSVYTGRYINVMRKNVEARWEDRKLWQTFIVEFPA